MYRFLIFITLFVINPLTSFSQELAWSLVADRSTDTKLYDRHDISTQNNQLVLDFSEFARNRKPIKVKLSEDATPNASFSFFTFIKSSEGSIQNSIIVSNKQEDSSDGWEIKTNELGGWEWNLRSNNKIVAEYKTIASKYAINDGYFHMLGFSYDFRKNQVWIYFDGEHIGVINVDKVNASGFNEIFIGGIGSNEKTAFAGYFKKLYLFKDVMRLGSVKRLYTNNPKYKGTIGTNGTFYSRIKVLTWNVKDGGTTNGNVVGPKRTLKILKDSKADIISLIEVKNSLEYFAEELGFYFYSINDNLAILSRFPIKRTLKIFSADKLGAVEISISKKQSLYFFNIALDNKADWSDFSNRYTDEEFRLKELESRGKDITEIMEQIEIILKPSGNTSIILSGELNSISAEDENGDYNTYPVSKIIHDYGFKDSYREFHPNSRVYPGYTRNTNSDKNRQGRVDYILYKGKKLMVNYSQILKKHPLKFPSSNYGVLTEFIWRK
jgi:exonuclease III